MRYVISSSWRGAHLFPRIRSLQIASTKYPELTPMKARRATILRIRFIEQAERAIRSASSINRWQLCAGPAQIVRQGADFTIILS